MAEKNDDDRYSEEETARRADQVIKRMLNTPPKPRTKPPPKQQRASRRRPYKGKDKLSWGSLCCEVRLGCFSLARSRLHTSAISAIRWSGGNQRSNPIIGTHLPSQFLPFPSSNVWKIISVTPRTF